MISINISLRRTVNELAPEVPSPPDAPTEFPPAPSDNTNDLIKTQAQWDSYYDDYLPFPGSGRTDGNDSRFFAFTNHYWLRAYVIMASKYGDLKYIDTASLMIDHMLNYTDRQRQLRGELNPSQDRYEMAPRQFLLDRSEAVPGWRRNFGSKWRNEVLSDGQICGAIMLVVDYIKTLGLGEPYASKADTWLSRCDEILHAHDTNWSLTKKPEYPGNYHYPNPNATTLDDSGLYGGVLPFNHQLTMAVGLALLDKHKSGGDATAQDMASRILEGFLDRINLTVSGGIARWNYIINGKVEDTNHAAINLYAINILRNNGYTVPAQYMTAFAKTLVEVVIGNDNFASELVDGTGKADAFEQPDVGYGWLDLYSWHPDVIEQVRKVMLAENRLPFVRSLLGWANILKYHNAPSTQAPGNPTPPEPEPEVPQGQRYFYDFDNSSRLILDSTITLTGDFEYSFKYKGTADAFDTLLSSAGNERVLRFDGSGMLQMYAAGGSKGTGTTQVNDGTEHTVRVERIGTTMTMYVDGQQEAQSTSGSGTVTIDIIGARGTGSRIQGELWDVVIEDNGTEVANLPIDSNADSFVGATMENYNAANWNLR